MKFITNQHKGDSRFQQGFGTSNQFRFLPGHRRAITHFLCVAKQENATRQKSIKSNKFHCNSWTSVTSKQTKLYVDAMASSESTQELDNQPHVQDQAKVTVQIRQQVAQWQRKHDMDEVMDEVKQVLTLT